MGVVAVPAVAQIVTAPPAQQPTLPDGTPNPNYNPPTSQGNNPLAGSNTGNTDANYWVNSFNMSSIPSDYGGIANSTLNSTYTPGNGTVPPNFSLGGVVGGSGVGGGGSGGGGGCQSAAEQLGVSNLPGFNGQAPLPSNFTQAILNYAGVGQYLTQQLIDDLRTNGLTPAVKFALQQAGFPPHILTDPVALAAHLGLPANNIGGQIVSALTPDELEDFEKLLSGLAALEGLDGLDPNKISSIVTAMNVFSSVPGLNSLSNQQIAKLIGGYTALQGSLNVDEQQIGQIFAASNQISQAMGVNLNVAQLGDMIGVYSQVMQSQDASAALASFPINNLNNFMPGYTAGEINSIMSQLKAIPGMENRDLSQIPITSTGGIQGVPDEHLASIFLGPNHVPGSNVTPEQRAKIQAGVNSLGALQGVNVTNAASIFGGLQAMSNNSAFSNMDMKKKLETFQKLDAFKHIQGINPNSVTGLLNGMKDIPGMEHLDLAQLNDFHNKFKDFAELPGLPKLPGGISGLEKLDLEKLGKFFDAMEKLAALDNLGAAKIDQLVSKLNSMGANELKDLMSKLSKVDMSKLASVLSKGQNYINSQINNVIGTSLNSALTRISGVTNALGSISFSSPACFLSSMVNLAFNCPMPTMGGNSAAGGGGGGGDSYSGLCLKGSAKPVFFNAQQPNNPTASPSGPPDTAPLDGGVVGAKPLSCMPNKNTDPRSTLTFNNEWLWQEMMPGDKEILKGFGGQYRRNDAMVGGLGGTESLVGFGCRGVLQTTDKCKLPEGGTPVFNRLKYDACGNEYTLIKAMQPWFIFDPKGAREGIDQRFCQPIKPVPAPRFNDSFFGSLGSAFGGIASGVASSAVNNAAGSVVGNGTVGNAVSSTAGSMAGSTVSGALGGGGGGNQQGKHEYSAAHYLKIAWNKVLVKPYMDGGKVKLGTTSSGGALLSDFYTEIVNDPKNKDNSEELDLDDMIQHPYERIFDPTHPFSPRWDHIGNERAIFSPGTFPGYGELNPVCSVRCAAVPVDIMKWRAAKFSARISCRMGINTACFWTDVMINASLPGVCPPPWPNIPCGFTVVRIGATAVGACWVPFYHRQKTPPCTTKYDEEDKNTYLKPACLACGKIEDICQDLARPLPPLNLLKIDTATEPKAEGYKFSDYFGNHRPYMRWWETGGEAGQSGDGPVDLASQLGSKDAIVGVGKEGSSCRYGGGAGIPQRCLNGQINIPNPDPITSWMELKLYQARTMREYHMNCLGQYEKLWKFGGAEDSVLARAGGKITVLDKDGRGREISMPNGWRGYVTDTKANKRFPMFSAENGTPATILRGMDNARPGDILIWDQDSAPDRMPHVAYVTGTYNRKSKGGAEPPGPDWVKIVDYNAGKYPDACGNTDAWQMGPERTLFKKVDGPPIESMWRHVLMKLSPILVNPNTTLGGQRVYTLYCDDVNMSACVEPAVIWDNVKIYRICRDIRGSSDKCIE